MIQSGQTANYSTGKTFHISLHIIIVVISIIILRFVLVICKFYCVSYFARPLELVCLNHRGTES